MTLDAFTTRVSEALGTRLVTLLLYGSAARASAGAGEPAAMNTLLIVDRVDADLFTRLHAPVREWLRARHPPPLILTEHEWRDATDAFPIEYEDIRAAHRLLAGRDPWLGIRIDRDDVRRQLEQELVGKLMHLRQSFAADWNSPKRLAEAARATWSGFLTMLRAVLRLAGRNAPVEPEALVREAAALIGFSPDGLASPSASPEPAAYLDAVTRTAEYVNRMERNAS
jgi:hypothetical protein